MRDGGLQGKVEDKGEQHDKHHLDITMNGEKPEEVTNFKYLGTTLSKDGTSTIEVLMRIAMATTAMALLSRLWTSSSASPPCTGSKSSSKSSFFL
ncbi:hypothetical protein DPMN_169708 [Dreissena polymorpha]|uniref:Uncharacterized protein n=1 Tax=Dreissena polymorpha TaxID=45954 RepID=A0A9D4DXW5_DREPO|nr:hypothetical protein DPMN_169708 [Dreissena polymorpha]